jgi:predicted nuclease with TOPRIM domain
LRSQADGTYDGDEDLKQLIKDKMGEVEEVSAALEDLKLTNQKLNKKLKKCKRKSKKLSTSVEKSRQENNDENPSTTR